MDIVSFMLLTGNSRYISHPKTYGYVQHKANVIGGAGSDPEPEPPEWLVVLGTGIVFSAIGLVLLTAMR